MIILSKIRSDLPTGTDDIIHANRRFVKEIFMFFINVLHVKHYFITRKHRGRRHQYFSGALYPAARVEINCLHFPPAGAIMHPALKEALG